MRDESEITMFDVDVEEHLSEIEKDIRRGLIRIISKASQAIALLDAECLSECLKVVKEIREASLDL